MALSSQPPEVLDIMASCVPLPSDLLSLALTSKALHAITVPQHLEFREVCCHGRRESLWKALAEHPGPTARILSLALIYEPVSRYQALHSNEQIIAPKSLTTSDVKISPQATSGLSNPNLIGCLRYVLRLPTCTPLERFTFDDSRFRIAFYDNTPSFDSISDPLWELANLTRASITVIRAPMMPPARGAAACERDARTKVRYHDWQDVFRQRIRRLQVVPNFHLAYPLLFALLQDPAAAYYVDDLEVDHTERDLAGELEGTDTPWMVPAPADEALTRRAVEEERWIPEEEKTTFVDRILGGDEDAMVTVMVLLIPNLRRLSLPTYCWGGLDFKYLMPIVARIAQAAANLEQDPVATLPLSKLEGQVFNGTYGVDFESIAPLMALPSLRTLSTEWNSEEGFDWPASLPKSNVREIDIKEGTLTSEAILRLAKGIRGPLKIPFEGAGEGDWVMILESDSDEDGDEA
ncbi:hypothetical protein C8R44DRAFT_887757 [Mycena epipterygia]|nr:hypothetical protein C8R44DRAFT_887757 [Mycena epipterygia]